MKHELNQEIYRVAFESANVELREISESFERLRLRKERIEKLVSVLKPIVGVTETTAAGAVAEVHTPEHSAEQAQHATASTHGGPEEAQELLNDPFQRRIDHVLGIGAGIRDVRTGTRQF